MPVLLGTLNVVNFCCVILTGWCCCSVVAVWCLVMCTSHSIVVTQPHSDRPSADIVDDGQTVIDADGERVPIKNWIHANKQRQDQDQ